MTYQKRHSITLDKAQIRLRGLQSVLPEMNLGNGLTLQDYAASVEASAARLEAHNLVLAEADRTRIEFAEAEASLSALSSRVLSATAAMYGRGSKEYEMAGGKPPSSYRRSRKQSSSFSNSSSAQSPNQPSNQPSNQSQNQASSDTAQSNGSATNGTRATAQPR